MTGSDQHRRAIAKGVLLSVLGVLAAGLAAAQDNVGVTAAVNPQARGTPPERPARTLSVGLDMFRNERIVTGPEGKTQLLFVDGSALSIGPNSEVVLDEFVYDPESGGGKLAMTATKGVFRLVGGKLTKSDPAVLKTPTATIGIRGGVATVALPDPATAVPAFVSLDFGKTLTVEGVEQGGNPVTHTVTRPGTGVVFGPGGTVLPPGPISPELLAGALNAVEGSRGSSGGAREQPTDARVQQANIALLGSALEPEVLRLADVLAADLGNVSTEVADVTDLTQASQGEAVARSSASSSPTSLGFTGRYKTTPGGSSRGSGDTSSLFNQTLTALIDNGIFKADLSAGTTSASSSFGTGTTFEFMSLASGTALSTTPRGTFFSFGSAGTDSPFGPIDGVAFLSFANDFIYVEGREINFVDDRSIAFAGIATPFSVLNAIPSGSVLAYDLRRDGILQGNNLPFLLTGQGGNLAGTRSPAFIARTGQPGTPAAFLQGNLGIVGQGFGQASAVSLAVGLVLPNMAGDNLNLLGQVRGSARSAANTFSSFVFGPLGFSTDAGGHGIYGAANPDYFVLEASKVDVGASGSSFANLQATSLPVPVALNQNMGSPFSSSPFFPNNFAQRIDTAAGVGSVRQSASITGFATGYADQFDSTGFFLGPSGTPLFSVRNDFQLSSNAALNTVSGTINDTTSSVTYQLPFGGATPDGRSAFVDNKLYGAVEASSGALRAGVTPTSVTMYIVGKDLVTTTGFLPAGVSFCDCAVSTYGFWGASVVHANGTDRFHLGQFVAGTIPVNVQTTGSAMYTGHFIADIVRTSGANAGGRFKAAGSMTMNYNFASAGGPFSITNFDGGSLTGSVSTTPGSPNYSGGVTGTTTNLGSASATVIGSFFIGPASAAQETGGFVTGSGTLGGGTNSVFTGVFQAKSQ